MARSKKLLTKGQIGAGFFNDHIEKAKKGLHAHATRIAKKHHAHIKTHMAATTRRLWKAKDRKAELNKVKAEMIKKGLAKANEIHEAGKAAAAVHVERLKKHAIKRVRSKVCGDVGEGFFSSIGNFFGKIFGGARSAAHAAIRQGTHVIKQHVQAAPAALKAHLVANKDKYIDAAKNAAVDIAQNGKQGINRTMEKVKKHMVTKARSVAGCKPKGSGMRVGGGGKVGGGMRVGGGLRVAGGAGKKTGKKAAKGRGARVAGGIRVAGGGMKVVY